MQKLQEEKYVIGKYSAFLVRFANLLACSGLVNKSARIFCPVTSAMCNVPATISS